MKAAQLHGHETPEMARAVKEQVRFVIQAFPAGSPAWRGRPSTAPTSSSSTPRAWLGLVFDWGLVDEAPQDARILLAGGLTAENVTTAIYRVNPWGWTSRRAWRRKPAARTR